ncbi:sulfotransferase family protein [Pseudodesulfovibrio pelocollis]|uniref:sulfotransferase family protein n=1 Tax=Pseudodesulfovibrio pelocollis TaxID=3051432 RepID=UPI00255B0522|nr:sulfotransferase [Pseudodesulfovibrio sp. SB368]
MNYLDNPIFICGHRKSGTTMLINLLDGNDEFVTYPDDSGFFYMYYPRYVSDVFNSKEKTDRICNRIINDNLKYVLKKIRCTPHELLKLESKADAFCQHVRNADLSKASLADVLKIFIDAFRNSFYPKITHPRGWIEKTTSTEIYALDIVDEFPNAKFVHVIRDPRDNWASLCSGWQKRYCQFNDEPNRLKQSMIERGRLGMEMAIENMEALGKNHYKIVLFEDLVSDPVSTMKDVAGFIGMSFCDKLLQTSTLGYTWTGNNFDGLKFTKPSNVNVSRWKERIPATDAMLMEFHFKNVMKHFGYDFCFTAKESAKAASDHYKWFNFSTPFSDK